MLSAVRHSGSSLAANIPKCNGLSLLPELCVARVTCCTKPFRSLPDGRYCTQKRSEQETFVTGLQARVARRGPGRREAICEAVFSLLAEVGYDRMTMDLVAERAHASKATIYRTWPDKPDMVVEAIVHHFDGAPDVPDTGSLRGDLLAIMTLACSAANTTDGDVISGVMTASVRTPPLATALRRCIVEAKRSLYETVIRRAAQRGEISADTDPMLLHEVTHAMVLSRKFWHDAPLTEEYAEHVVDDVLLPILRR
jgi:AcrR family transcriptional regulator